MPPDALVFDDGEPLETNRHRIAMNVLIDSALTALFLECLVLKKRCSNLFFSLEDDSAQMGTGGTQRNLHATFHMLRRYQQQDLSAFLFLETVVFTLFIID